METLPPFKRVIHPADLESLYKYPRVDSYVPGGTLWAIVLSVPCVLSILAWGCCNDCNDAFEVRVELLNFCESFLDMRLGRM